MSPGLAHLFLENGRELYPLFEQQLLIPNIPAFLFSELPPTLFHFLEVFEACRYAPTLEHPLVKELIASNSEDLEEQGSSAFGG
jgi:hypothetical protein